MPPLYEELSFAKVDLHRARRRRFPEVIYAGRKSADQIGKIAGSLRRRGQRVLITKVSADLALRLTRQLSWLTHFPEAGLLAGPFSFAGKRSGSRGGRPILVITAGTSDIPVAEEAAVTLELMGRKVERLYDVGVAGLHRLLKNLRLLRRASVVVVVAGMDGALPAVVSGLISRPVVAVPTSVGYGASLRGLAALLTMMNSCSPGVAVVNIDNGFGAGYLAGMISRKR